MPSSQPKSSDPWPARVRNIAARRKEAEAELLSFADTDALCYRAHRQDALRQAQAESWDPLLAWIHEAHGCAFTVTTGISPATVPRMTKEKLATLLQGTGDAKLTALHAITRMTGSLILGLAVLESRLSADEALYLSRLEEEHQQAAWGIDDEAAARAEALQKEMQAAEQFLRSC